MAQDSALKRQNIALAAIRYSTQFVDALNGLLELKEERAKLAQPFVESDFQTTLAHLTEAILGNLFDFVVPSLQANYIDVANGGRNEQILLQMRQ